ncbi:MAG: twin-arginine translocase subunit TatB [Gammaproteobacteria bacterium]|nr:twin-arginine translocase subunit TatB [Gammaproteobacteria bacterium]
MFDIGFWELVVIGVVALIVIGPERLPDVARTVGKYVGRMRRFVAKVREDIDREVRQEEIRQALKRNADIDEIKNIINDSRYVIEDEVQETKHVVKARDDDPRGDFSQKDMLKEQDKDFENETYGLTDHRDHGAEEHTDTAVQPETTEAPAQASNPNKQDGGRNEKSNG